MKKVFTFLGTALFAVAVRGAAPESAAGVYRGSSGIESREITLLKDGNYLARWDGDTGSNGAAVGSWALVGNEVRLTPRRESGPLMTGHFRVLLLREFGGKRALLRKEDEKFSDNPFFYLYLRQKVPDQPAPPTRPSGG